MKLSVGKTTTFQSASSRRLELPPSGGRESTCGDARGAYCASMDHVDQMINSGEIENFNERRLNKKYKQTNNNILTLEPKVNEVEINSYEASDVGN
jgi:hypothetical protein